MSEPDTFVKSIPPGTLQSIAVIMDNSSTIGKNILANVSDGLKIISFELIYFYIFSLLIWESVKKA